MAFEFEQLQQGEQRTASIRERDAVFASERRCELALEPGHRVGRRVERSLEFGTPDTWPEPRNHPGCTARTT